MTFGLDIGTTSVAGVAVEADGRVVATETCPHGADLPPRAPGVDEQDPEKFLAAARAVLAALKKTAGTPERIGWTGQMHGVVAVDEALAPLTPFVTWRDRRRYGGAVMREWREGGLRPYRFLTAPGFVLAHLTGRCVIDPTFLESWHLATGSIPASALPEVREGEMLGDNQAGVFAAQMLLPGAAVINLGTSGQLSVVADAPRSAAPGTETRLYPGGKRLICRASLIGGQALAHLRRDLGLSWEEINARAESDARIRACVAGIVDDLALGMDLSGVKGLVGVGNALRLNPCLRRAVERRFGLPCLVPEITEMAAYGAAALVGSCVPHDRERKTK